MKIKDELVFYFHLFKAKRLADKFYAEYPHLTKNIAYGPNPTQKLDVYRPGGGAGYPALIYVHGGNWSSSNKEIHAPVAQRLMPEEFVVVIVGYTLHPPATYRRQTTDVALAIAWVLENIERYGGDPHRVIVGGHSAGAHLAALAVFDEQWLALKGHCLAEIAGFYGISGVYDIEAEMAFCCSIKDAAQLLRNVMESEANFRAASPITYVRPGLPPALLIHGDVDTTVPATISEAFHARLLAAGNSSRRLIYPNTGHSQLLFKALAEKPSRLVSDLSEFVRDCKTVEKRFVGPPTTG